MFIYTYRTHYCIFAHEKQEFLGTLSSQKNEKYFFLLYF